VQQLPSSLRPKVPTSDASQLRFGAVVALAPGRSQSHRYPAAALLLWPRPVTRHPAVLQLHARHPTARTRSACRLCCSTLNFQPVFGPPTPRPYRRLACRALLLGRRPRKPQAGCAPALPADAAGAQRSNVSTMVSGPFAEHVSTEAKIANIRLPRPSDRGGVRAVSLQQQNRNSRRTRIGGQSSARVYKASMEPRPDWDLWKALVQCWTRSIPAC
jgi:hypothetical protein